MHRLHRALRSGLLASILCAPSFGCATILGTAVSPITGGVDLVRQTQSRGTWYLWAPVFVGGAIAGPFVAFYNGVNHDASVFRSWGEDRRRFDEVFRPFEMIDL